VIVAAAVVAVLAGFPGLSGGGTPASPGPDAGFESAGMRVARVLLKPGRGEPEVARALAGLGPDAVPILLLCATGEVYGALPDGALGESQVLAVDPDRIPAVAVEALGAMERGVVLDALALYLEGNDTLAARTGAARVLAELATADGLDLAFALLRDASDAELRAPYVRGPLRDALAAPLAAQDHALARIDRGLGELDHARLLVVVEALEAAERGDAAGLLAVLLRSDAALAPELLGALGGIAERRPFEVAQELDLQTLLAPFLASERAEVRAAAARAAGRAQAGEVAWALAERLGDDSPEVRAAARSALRSMAGVDHGYDVDAWSLAIEVERRWRDGGGLEQALTEVAGEDLSQAATALRHLAGHGLSRRAIGAEVGELLPQLPDVTARTAAATLASMGTRSAVPGLVELLGRTADAQVRSATHAALTHLTDAELPAEAAAWRSWLERDGTG
jgi:HEAT repeat protein